MLTGQPVGDAPAALRVTVEGSVLTMRTRRRPHPVAVIIGLVFAGIGAFVLLETWTNTFEWAGLFGLTVGAIIGGGFTAIGLGLPLARVVIVQVLRVGPDRVETWHVIGPHAFGRSGISADLVREVTLGKPPVHPLQKSLGLKGKGPGNATGGPCVNVVGEECTLSFGHVLRKESRAWVRDCIVAILTGGEGR